MSYEELAFEQLRANQQEIKRLTAERDELKARCERLEKALAALEGDE